ncbi:MAG: transporter associated domain-containing protein [Pseudomonadales bacterium]|nr:transporter associated domain-containing protein [Pseudomonadales bacterium]
MTRKPKPPEPDSSWLSRVLSFFSGDRSSARQQLKTVLREAEKDQVIDTEALSIIEGAMQVSNMQVRDIMIPRSQLVTVNASTEPGEFLPIIIESGHSRFPVLGEGPDEVVGILLAKDLLPLSLDGKLDEFQIKDHLRAATAVPESKALNVLLREFRTTHNHMAIVFDEYGHFGGAVTIEDVLEQIVGEIEDEYDVDDDSYIKKFDDNTFVVKALTEIEEFNDYFKTNFSLDEFDTIGGIVLQSFGRLPKRDDSITIGSLNFRVLNADNRRIHLLRVTENVENDDL